MGVEGKKLGGSVFIKPPPPFFLPFTFEWNVEFDILKKGKEFGSSIVVGIDKYFNYT